MDSVHHIWCPLSSQEYQDLPDGAETTLTVNLVGGFIIGMALAFFVRQPHLDPAWKFFITTGLCGGMTTFSTFSAEVVVLLQNGNYAWAVISVLTHVTGSLLMTAAGFFVMTLL
ncbi:fluoride efflux transporter CrcB (plasmid) [Klebsiella pneumoniae]